MRNRILLCSGLCLLLVCAGYAFGEGGPDRTSIVENGTMVKLSYVLKVDGEVVDTSPEGAPIEYSPGMNQMIPGFEKAVHGMKAGEKKTFIVTPEEGFGLVDPSGFKEIPRDILPPNITPEEGMVLYAKGTDERMHPVVISELKKDVVVMNFNHPLAGKSLEFNVEIIEIKSNAE